VFNEYVYMSDDKVREFIPRDLRWWSRLRAKKLTGRAGVAGVGATLELEPADLARSAKQLEKIEEYISEHAPWYTVPDLKPGDWVLFEARIGYQVTDRDPAGGAVLFCQAGRRDDPARRIFLHGSASNLVGQPAATASGESGGYGYSSPGGFSLALEAFTGPQPERSFWQRFTTSATTPVRFDQGSLPHHLQSYFENVACTDWFWDQAPNLGGWARITTIIDLPTLPFDVVVASPLFVRHQRP
jgi:hypothetical protein